MRMPCLRALLVPLPAGIAAAAPAPAEALPELRIEYDATADQDCAQRRHYEIRPAWVAELLVQLPALRTLWAEQGPGLLRAVGTLTGRPVCATTCTCWRCRRPCCCRWASRPSWHS